MKRLAIGPRTVAPSWEWVGQSLADRLPGHCTASVFDSFDRHLDVDVILVIKQRPPRDFMQQSRQRGTRVVFAPIDVYGSPSEIEADADMLRACSAVLLHSEALRPFIRPFCANLISIDHHARFAIPLSEVSGQGDFILWTGALQHVPHLVAWHAHARPPCDVVIASNLDDARARLAAHAVAYGLGMRLDIGTEHVNGIRAMRWSPAVQTALMRDCRAAIDIKGHSFAQLTKPPTKAQQFVASGIPFGANARHPALGWFRDRGFEIADAADWQRLLSSDYRAQTRRFAEVLQSHLTIEAVQSVLLAGLAPLWQQRDHAS